MITDDEIQKDLDEWNSKHRKKNFDIDIDERRNKFMKDMKKKEDELEDLQLKQAKKKYHKLKEKYTPRSGTPNSKSTIVTKTTFTLMTGKKKLEKD